MTLDEVKEALAKITGALVTNVSVEVEPIEGQNFALKIGAGAAITLDANDLTKLLDLGKEAGMQVYVIPGDDQTMWVQLKKDVTISITV